jgi:serine/threonine protein phosphatase 1
MLSWIKKNKHESKRKLAATPVNSRIYAIGDIHGRFDLLQKLHGFIIEDAREVPHLRKVIIYIGDYVDRGLESKQVIEYLVNDHIEGFEQVFLKGNHEDALLAFLTHPELGEIWLSWGGMATVQSYGVGLTKHGKRLDIEELSTKFAQALPDAHLKFMHNLKINHIEGDYLFVHAGIRPGIELVQQTEKDMIMIRDEFFNVDYPCADKTVVFGHTIFDQPFCKTAKIAIDTGAYATGRLTAAVLEGESVRFIST